MYTVLTVVTLQHHTAMACNGAMYAILALWVDTHSARIRCQGQRI